MNSNLWELPCRSLRQIQTFSNGTQDLNEAIEIFTASNLCACTNVTVASRKNLHTLYYRLFIELFWHFSGPKLKHMFERSLKLGIATYTEVI